MTTTHTHESLKRDGVNPDVRGRAWISECERYRYTLERDWSRNADARYVLWLMLNPSTAGALTDDATIRRCLRFARDWGYTGILVGNLYAYRATDPGTLARALLRDEDIVGPQNDAALASLTARASLIVCAWGQSGPLTSATVKLLQHLRPPRVAHSLRMNLNCCPSHPLRLPANLTPQVWEPFKDLGNGHGG